MDMLKLLSFVILLLLNDSTVRCFCQTIAQVNNLSSSLLRGYNKHTRPINDQSRAVQVDVNMWLFALRVFDELLGKLSTGILFRLSWVDESLVWDPRSHHNISKVTVSQRDVWTPMLTVSNPHSRVMELGDSEWVTIQVYPDGRTEWLPVTMADTACSIDTRFYPFDSQTCTIEMITFGHGSAEVNLTISSSSLNVSLFDGHATWKILRTSVQIININDAALLKLSIRLQRQPMFIVVNFLVPILTLSFLNPLAFLLPVDSGERIGFSMTILLALSVFMTILGDYLPKNAEPMSLLAYLLMSLYICSASVVLIVILSIKVFAIPDSKALTRVARFVLVVVSCNRTCSCNKRGVPSDGTDSTTGSVTLQFSHSKIASGARDYFDEKGRDGTCQACQPCWRDVSCAIDKLAFGLLYTSIGLFILIFMAVIRV